MTLAASEHRPQVDAAALPAADAQDRAAPAPPAADRGERPAGW
jgi:hypothetical protein